MRGTLNSREWRALADLLGLPHALTPQARAHADALSLHDVMRLLDLPELAGARLVGMDRWIAGGGVLRWLVAGLTGRRSCEEGDLDLFLPSLAALNSSTRALLASGHHFRCIRSLNGMCQLCGGPAEQLAAGRMEHPSLPLHVWRCSVCGDFGGAAAPRLPGERVLELTPGIVAARRVLAMELGTPSGGIVHLSVAGIGPSLSSILAGFDFSIAQFGVDGDRLVFGPYAWTDLLLGRLRLSGKATPRFISERLAKYIALGFRPYLRTRLSCALLHWGHYALR